MQLLHHRSAMLLMKPQPLLRREAALARLGIMTVHLAQHLQYVAALLGEVRRHFDKLPSTVGVIS